jgi:hypothetical protein
VASGNNLLFNSGYVSIGSSATPFPLYVVGSGQTVIMGATNTPSGVSVGVWGQSSSSNGRGIYGYATSATGGSYGGLFRTLSNQGIGVFALADSPTGATTGIRGQSASVDGTGLWGFASAPTGETNGVFGRAASTEGVGVSGLATSATGVNYGVYGETTSLVDGFGVYSVGDSATTGLKLFQIDHPLDPDRKLLNHFSEEGPEPYLVYRGNATIAADGRATVSLPEYFDAINREPTYQLTPIGGPAVLYIAQEIADNRFVIGGGLPGMKVSWMVTGIRNDSFVRCYGARREVDKPKRDVGRYLHPELLGFPPSRSMRPRPLEIDVGSDIK